MKIAGVAVWIWGVGVIVCGALGYTAITAAKDTRESVPEQVISRDVSGVDRKRENARMEAEEVREIAQSCLNKIKEESWSIGHVADNENDLATKVTAGAAQLQAMKLADSKQELEKSSKNAQDSIASLKKSESKLRSLGIKDPKYYFSSQLENYRSGYRFIIGIEANSIRYFGCIDQKTISRSNERKRLSIMDLDAIQETMVEPYDTAPWFSVWSK